MQNDLKTIQDSYDKAIELGKQGIDPYNELPTCITEDPDYKIYRAALEETLVQGNNRQIVLDYLKPAASQRFIDLGCGLNLMFRGYEKREAEYYGIDISPKGIEMLKAYVRDNKLRIGSLVCGSINSTPFDNSLFDIGECIGVLEYYEKEFVEDAIKEMHRILKPNGKIVIDIPNIGNAACRIMMKIEEFLNRPDKFNMPLKEFEDIVKEYFCIDRVADDDAVVVYFLQSKKKRKAAAKRI